MDQLPRLGKRELICLLLFTCNYVLFVWRGFLFLWVLGMGYVILLWHSLSLPYNYLVCSTERALITYIVKKAIDMLKLKYKLNNMSRVVRKPDFCICENKDADQLRGNREADQCLCFRCIDSKIHLLSKSEIQASSHLL